MYTYDCGITLIDYSLVPDPFSLPTREIEEEGGKDLSLTKVSPAV